MCDVTGSWTIEGHDWSSLYVQGNLQWSEQRGEPNSCTVGRSVNLRVVLPRHGFVHTVPYVLTFDRNVNLPRSVPPADASRFAYMLNMLAGLIELGQLEARLTALEKAREEIE